MEINKKELLEELKGMHLTIDELIEKLGDKPKQSELTKQGMSDVMQDYLNDIAMLIDCGRHNDAGKMARKGAKLDWRKRL